MGSKYLIRLDDACPTQHQANWRSVENILDAYNVKPLVAVVPDCKDPGLQFDKPLDSFWILVDSWRAKGWTIGMHGYQHLFVHTEKNKSLVPIHERTEFAGLPFEEQSIKIKNAWSMFLENNIKPTLWVAPAHTFDTTTLEALYRYTDIRIVSDCFALNVFTFHNFFFIPQQLWHFRKMPVGLWTICLHPSDMKDEDFIKLEQWIKNQRDSFIDLSHLQFRNRKWGLVEKLINDHLWFDKNKMKVLKKLKRRVKSVFHPTGSGSHKR